MADVLRVKTVTEIATTNSVGQTVESLPVRSVDGPVQNEVGVWVDPIDVEEADDGVPVRFVDGLTTTNSIGQPVAATPVKGVGAAKKAASNIALVSGDSTATTTGPYSGSASALRVESGWMVTARQLLKGKTDWNKARVIGQGGITSGTYISTYLSNALASDASHVWLSLFINDTLDTNSVDTATALANIDTILDAFVAAGKVVFFTNTWPSTNGAWNVAKAHAIRDKLRAKHSPKDGLYLVESWNAIATAVDSDTPKASALQDGLHLATRGAQGIGRVAASVAASALPAFDPVTDLTWLNTSDLSGTSGTANGTQVSGTVPTGYSVNQGGLNTGSLVCSVVNVDGVNKLKLVATNLGNGTGAGTFDVRGPSNALTGFTAGTDHVDSLLRVELEAGHNGIGQIGLANRRNGGQYLPSLSDTAYDAKWAGSNTDFQFDGEAMDAYLRPPAYTWTAAATQLYLTWLDVGIVRNQLANFTMYLSLPRNRIKTNLFEAG